MPNYTLPNSGTIYSSEVTPAEMWEGFWYVAAKINGNILWDGEDDTEVNLGDSIDSSADSLNLDPHKIKWDVAHGHDHSNSSQDGPIGAWATAQILKSHFDLNDCKVLWMDFWSDEETSDKYMILYGSGNISSYDSSGNPWEYSESPTMELDHSDFYLNDSGTFDSFWTYHSYKPICIICNIAAHTDGGTSYLGDNLGVGVKTDSFGEIENPRLDVIEGVNTAEYDIYFLVVFQVKGT